jgi:glycosyltransferase involved in cell wall biosynthesis
MNKRAKIVMNAMVGSESKTITRMLESVAPHIDYWVVQCNGTDNTQQIIEEFFKEKNIPGFTYTVEWNFPGWNRDHTLQECLKANHGCDWILRMDADETLEIDDDFDWSILNNTNIDSFNVCAVSSDTRYFRTWLWNAKLPWFFQHDKRHETIHLPEISEDFQRINLPQGFRHKVSQDGETWYVPRKFLRDALELEIDKVVGYKVLEDHYHLWYVAKSYSDCYGKPSELPFGKEHSDEYARRSIWYFKKFLEVTQNWKSSEDKVIRQDEMAYFALVLMGIAYDFIGDEKKSDECFANSELFSDSRNEHFLNWALTLEKRGRLDEMLTIIDKMEDVKRVNPFPDRTFLIEDRAYYNTSTFLKELRERVIKKQNEHTVNMDSVKFDFE